MIVSYGVFHYLRDQIPVLIISRKGNVAILLRTRNPHHTTMEDAVAKRSSLTQGFRPEILEGTTLRNINKLYDRDDQMSELIDAYQRCCLEPSSRQREIVFITGSSGGKKNVQRRVVCFRSNHNEKSAKMYLF